VNRRVDSSDKQYVHDEGRVGCQGLVVTDVRSALNAGDAFDLYQTSRHAAGHGKIGHNFCECGDTTGW